MNPQDNPYSAPTVTSAPPAFTTSPHSFNTAGHGQRFLNYLLDTVFLLGILFAGAFIYAVVTGGIVVEDEEEGELMFQVIFIGVYTLYYAICEGLTGRTIGKLITGTKVVDATGNKPSFGKALARSLCRHIPFEPFSVLRSDARGWHDSIAKTWVVKSR
jgi:uncharacterized RDD family membrane protein YckC